MNHFAIQHHSLYERRDGFHVRIDEQQTRADITLAQPPTNCLSPRQFEQLRMAFERLDDNPNVRVIVLRAAGDHFSNTASAQLEAEIRRASHARLAWDINAPLRCSKPV